MHIPYAAEFINRNQLFELDFQQVAYGILFIYLIKRIWPVNFGYVNMGINFKGI